MRPVFLHLILERLQIDERTGGLEAIEERAHRLDAGGMEHETDAQDALVDLGGYRLQANVGRNGALDDVEESRPREGALVDDAVGFPGRSLGRGEQRRIDAPAHFADRIYDATPGTVLAEINAVGDDVATLLVIGHEPVMSGLTLGLAGADSDTAAVAGVDSKYPTSAKSLLEVGGSWRDLQLGGARLAHFHVPR